MSTYTIEQLRSQVLTLSEPERAELAHELIKSLDAPADEGVEDAWDQEIIRRIAQIDAGQAKLLDREEFRKKIQARIGNQ
jgi:putative addiction module component (TIGR02574 family)